MSFLKAKYDVAKNLHLTISIIILIPIALAYGVHPNIVLSKFFDFKADTIDLKNIFRALMGLYSAMVIIWAIGIIKPKFWATATITNIVFMGGLALGRLISLALDGLPTIYFSIGLILELALAAWGLKNLKKYGLNFTEKTVA